MPFYIAVPQEKEDGYIVEWEASYDFNGEDIIYTFELSDNYNFNKTITSITDLSIPMAKFDKLPAGQYFMRVAAQNESGQTQYAFDCYRIDLGKIYGTKCFYVDDKGQIVEDVYVED